MKKVIGLALTIIVLAIPVTTFAHSKVTPAETGIAQSEVFTATIENEKDIPTKSVRIVLPGGLDDVDPYAKAGWTVQAMEDGEETKEIIWIGGQIPGRLKDIFVFGAKAPATEQTLTWKIYQTYADNTVVSWTNTEKNAERGEGSNVGPASYTKVIDDLTEETAAPASSNNTGVSSTLGLIFGLIGALTGVTALLIAAKKRTSSVSQPKENT